MSFERKSRTIALDGDLGDAAGAGLSPGGDLDGSGGGVGEGSRSRGDSNSALHGCGKGEYGCSVGD